jgi:DNA-directed RNA polymerase specialized sigma24 family protein
MTTATPGLSIASRKTEQQPSRDQEQLDQFTVWFTRCHKTLHYMADLILNNSEMAEHAVENCRHKASRDLPGFESEGEFRGWIFRVLINEALRISTQHY